jgi:predicted metal-dependent peptidase
MSDLNDPVYREIVAARVKLLFEKPFFGNLAARLIAVDATDWCKTAATDGRHLFYNREFIKSLDKAELLFLIAHEVLHCVYDTLGRRGGRDPKLYNMASDYIINYTLVEEKCGTMPKSGLYDKRYTDEMASEEVYALLQKDSVTIRMPLDEHLELGADGDDQDGDGDGDGQYVDVTVTGKNGPPKLSEDDIQRIRSEIKAAVIQSAQQVGAGKVPAGVRRMIDELLTPKMDWRSLLDAHIRSSIKDDYTFSRISRRTWSIAKEAADGLTDRFDGGANSVDDVFDAFGAGVVPMLPAQDFMDTVDVAAAIDCSGSMSEEMLRDFLSEVKGIMTTFRDFKVRLWVFDTEIYNYKEFTAENIHEIDEYGMAGGGGTMFECNWEHMKREGIEPQRFVMFTDGYPGGTWGDPNYCDTLFVVHGSNHNLKAPFGITCYYDPKDKKSFAQKAA